MGAVSPPGHPSWEQNRRYWDENRRYWEQFGPPGTPRRIPRRRIVGLLLLLMALGGVAHALVYRWDPRNRPRGWENGAGEPKNGSGDTKNGAGGTKNGAGGSKNGSGGLKNRAGDTKNGSGGSKMGLGNPKMGLGSLKMEGTTQKWVWRS